MYKKVDADHVGEEFKERYGIPVLVIEDEYGGRVAVIIDDHCYVAMIKRDNGYKAITHIWQELFEEMQKLPSPQ